MTHRLPHSSRAAVAAACLALAAAAVLGPAALRAGTGYDDTPMLPGGQWRVHDSQRPCPPVVTPPTASTPEKPGQPPSDAIVLFDGKDLAKWQTWGKDADKGKLVDAKWKVENGYTETVPGAGNLITRDKFGDCQIHLEWASPAQVKGNSQERGNSGVMIMGRYEIQVLDSFDNETYADGQAASMYGLYPPLVNASRGPGEWQTYDIFFEAPRFEGGKLVRPAYVTVVHNGLVVQNHRAFMGTTRHRALASYSPHEPEASFELQEHGCPVRFRNIWVRRLPAADAPAANAPAANAPAAEAKPDK